MLKEIIISKYFFKKSLKDIISFSIILLIASLLFSCALVLKNNISKSFDNKYESLNTASAFFIIPATEFNDKILEEIRNIQDIKEAEIQRGLMLNIPVKMNDSTQDQNQIFYNKDDNHNLNKIEIVKETKDNLEHGIYLANYTFLNSNLNLKDKYEFKIDNISYTFNIKGVINEMQYGNYTSSTIGQYIESASYNILYQNHKDKEVVVISVISKDDNQAYNKVSKYLSNKSINILNRNYKEQSKNQRLAISNILILILIVFAGSILIISLFVSKFKIEQSIEEEIANMGALQALGYTSNEIIIASILPYILSGFIFTLLGIILSYLLLPTLSLIIQMQSGFIWKSHLDLLSNLTILLINLGLIILFTTIASFKIKKLNPINAIRGLNENKSDKNYFEIEKTKGNIHFILMLKNFMYTKKQNLLLGIMLLFMCFISSFIGILFYNINMNPINFINTLVEEHPSIIITSKKNLKNQIINQRNVKNVIYYDENVNVNYEGNSYKTFVAESFNNLANDLCYEGNNPQNSNEVAIGSKLAETYNISIGDYIDLQKNNTKSKYKVVGFVQSVNYSGEILELTLDGYQKMDNAYIPETMYIYLNDEDSSENFITDIESKYNEDIISTMNYSKSMDSAMDMYVSLISIVCIIIIIITLLLIYLILYIVISSIIIRKKQELGIFKAIGYQNRQLVKQLIGGFIPSIIISTTIGAIISKLFMNNIYKTIFKAVGAYKVSFEYPIIIFIIIAILLILSTIVIGIVLAKKIKKISVYSLIKD